MTPKGHMSSNGSGPAIMMMPNHVRATFMPGPPLKYQPLPKRGGASRRPTLHGGNVHHESDDTTPVRTSSLDGVSSLLVQFERTAAQKRQHGTTPASAHAARVRKRAKRNTDKLEPLVATYRAQQKETAGEFDGMNCYNTLFVGRLAYETTERKLLRELEAYGPVKDLKLVWRTENNDTQQQRSRESSGYAFVEFENEEDMKRAYRAADGMKLDGREIVVDVERGHTVPNWLPRRLGGGLGGTRLGGKDKNITAPGRFDPSKESHRPMNAMNGNNHNGNHNMMNGPHGGDRGRPGDYGGGGNFHHDRRGGPPDNGMMRGGGPPPGNFRPGYGNGGGGGGPHGGHNRGGPPPYGGDRYGGGGGGGPPPMDRYGPPPGGRYNDRGGPPPSRGGGFDRRYDDRGGPRGGGPYPDHGNKRHRSRSRSKSPPSSRRRFRG